MKSDVMYYSELSYINNSNSLFHKYASLITWFSNTQLGRSYISQDTFPIPKEEIALFLPNGYHIIKDRYKDKFIAQLIVTPSAVYEQKLHKALLALDLVHQWIQDFDEAKMILLGQLGLIPWGRIPTIAKNIRFTTSTFNPDAHPETTCCDGYTYGTDDTPNTWAATRALSSGVSALCNASASGGSGWYIQKNTGDSFAYFRRAMALFDTSTLGAVDISSAVYSYYVTSKERAGNGWTDAQMATSLVASSPASNTDIVADDFDQYGSTKFATDGAYASASVNAYFDFSMNATGIAAIAKTGITKLGIRCAADVDNSYPSDADPTGAHGVYGQSAEDANKPKLVITYEASATGAPWEMLMTGVGR